MARQTPKLITGRVSVHRDGFGFLTPDQPVTGVDGDIFLPPDVAAKAMHGDRAAVKITRYGRDGRAEGDIAKILERANATIVGTFRVRRRGFWVEPYESRLRHWIQIPETLALPKGGLSVDRIGASGLAITKPADLDGMVVNAEIVEFPKRDEEAIGRIVEVLGHPGDFGVDVEIMIRKYRIPHRFPPDVLEEAQSVLQAVSPEGREDFRHLPIVTIDGETARDFDDAVWVDRLPNGNFALQVHIADVSHYVRPGSAIDREAALRGTSVYFPDRAVPMLPLELSTGICSLKPHVDRLVMSAIVEIDRQGNVVHQRFTRGIIRSAERMTYTGVHALLEGDPAEHSPLRDRYAAHLERFGLMKELALILNRRRHRRGSIDFDMPEAEIAFDEDGRMTGVSRAARNIAHRLIEEFMLVANEAVASHIEEAGSPMIFRVHEQPDPKRVVEFEEVASQFGVSLGIGVTGKKFRIATRHRDGRKTTKTVEAPPDVNITSRHYQKLVQQIEGTPLERILSYLMLRSLKQARYAADNLYHFALASKSYTHFTSPIRRYPDLLVHRLLGALLDSRKPPYEAERLASLADHSSTTERRAADAERELMEWKKVKFMEQHVGDEFDALIISTTKYGFFVELADLFIEGLVPIDSLDDDRYGFHESTRRIVGQHTRHEYKIGDPVRVCLDRIDGMERRLQFSVVPPAGRARPRSRPSRKSRG